MKLKIHFKNLDYQAKKMQKVLLKELEMELINLNDDNFFDNIFESQQTLL